MQQRDKYLVVLSLIDGRNFPSRPRFHLIAEARFDGELLCSDPVPHTQTPEINQELAWELDRKGLQQHRLQRSSIKLILYAVDNASPVKETIGYILLDVRSASDNKTVKWYPILHCKYAKLRPQLSVALYLDDGSTDNAPLEDSNLPAKSALASSLDPQSVKAYLRTDNVGGYYQIGAEKLCREAFVLSVSLLCAGNLFSLFPSSIQLPSTGQNGFHFHYTIFGNPVNSETFSDLVCSEFPAERSSIRIRSTCDLLRVYFSSQEPRLTLHLVCGNKSLGQCDLPLYELITTSSGEGAGGAAADDVHWNNLLQQPSIVEGVFQLNYSNSSGAKDCDGEGDVNKLEHDSDKPWVAVSVVLRRASTQVPQPSARIVQLLQQRMSQLPPVSPQANRQANIMADKVTSNKNTFKTLSPLNSSNREISRSANDVNRVVDEEVQSITETKLRRVHSTGTVPNVMHRLCFTVELRSIRNVSVATHTLHIYARYVYPLFGSAAPIITHPPVQIRRNQEVLFPQGFCTFEFASDEESLREHLKRQPLMVEIYSRERSQNEDELIGVVSLDLSTVLSAKLQMQTSRDTLASPTHVAHINSPHIFTKVTRRTIGGVAALQSKDNVNNSKVGEISYQLSLEDFGELPLQASNKSGSSPSNELMARSSPHRQCSSTSAVVETQSTRQNAADARASLEYRAAMELELWKENQEQLFRNQLLEKEKAHMLALAEEWARRDKEREIITKRKITEYQELEETLQATLRDLTTRERRLEQAEADLSRQRQEASREHSSVLAELRAASQRVQSEGDHKVAMEKEQTQHWKQRAEEWQAKWVQLDKEFSRYRDRQEHSTESKLQAQMAQLKLENIEMEKRLDEAMKSKMHYKAEWAKALKELARLKLRAEELAREQMKRQEMQLEHMRLRYLSTEESNVRTEAPGSQRELEEIKRELDELREEALSKQKEQKQSAAPIASLPVGAEMSDHLTHLIEERDCLLRTGVYSLQDEPICELDREIRRCIAASGCSYR